MNHIGLFEGIGGFSLAARWMGWETIAWCEWNEFGQKVLKHHFPKAAAHGDITKTDFTIYRGHCNVLTGGFPCQPYSLAGKRKGKEDDRHLWPEMCRAIREIQPTWVVGENVFGLVNWDGGLVFNEVQADLEAEGYEVFPYVLPAVSVNAPHRRDRIWFVSFKDTKCNGFVQREFKQKGAEIWEQRNACAGDSIGVCGAKVAGTATNPNSANSKTWTQREVFGQQNRQKTDGHSNVERPNQWQNFPTQSPICSGDDGISTQLDSITFPKWRNESIKAAGNAIVPQVVFQIFKAIQQYIQTHEQESFFP